VSYVVVIRRRDGSTAREEFAAVEGALALVNDTLRRWADNVLSVAVEVRRVDDCLGKG
jgi:hypothetical protein